MADTMHDSHESAAEAVSSTPQSLSATTNAVAPILRDVDDVDSVGDGDGPTGAAGAINTGLDANDSVLDILSASRQGAARRIVDTAARASGVECICCVRPVTNNRTCPQCSASFCSDCLETWWAVHPSQHGANCPTCRLDTEPVFFVHNPSQQAVADTLEVTCDCGVTFVWGDRMTHFCELEGPCPYQGCDFWGHPDDLDLHTARCLYANRYLTVKGVRWLAGTRHTATGKVELPPEKMATVVARAEEARAAAASAPPGPNDSVRHYIMSSDNLQGVAVKYGTTVQEIKRLNRLTANNLWALQWIWVPRPPNYQSEQLDVPSLNAMIALQKRELVQEVKKQSSVSVEEAVAYLHLADWDATKASDIIKRDAEWATDARFRERAQTLEDFMSQCRASERRVDRGRGCATCAIVLGRDRVHCSACGKIVCMDCHLHYKENATLVKKSALGVTSPSAKDQLVQVCDDCAVGVVGTSSSSSKTNHDSPSYSSSSCCSTDKVALRDQSP